MQPRDGCVDIPSFQMRKLRPQPSASTPVFRRSGLQTRLLPLIGFLWGFSGAQAESLGTRDQEVSRSCDLRPHRAPYSGAGGRGAQTVLRGWARRRGARGGSRPKSERGHRASWVVAPPFDPRDADYNQAANRRSGRGAPLRRRGTHGSGARLLGDHGEPRESEGLGAGEPRLLPAPGLQPAPVSPTHAPTLLPSVLTPFSSICTPQPPARSSSTQKLAERGMPFS